MTEMRVLEMTGVVTANELNSYDENIEGPMIDGAYVIDAFSKVFGPLRETSVTVLLAHGGDEAIYRGTAWMHEGSPAYSSWTPASGPSMWVGGSEDGISVDLLEKLEALDGQTVHLRIDDGPAIPSTSGPNP